MGTQPRFGHPREWLLAVGALGLVIGLSWADERYTCSRFDDGASDAELASRDHALEDFADARCEELGCEAVEALPARGCVAKLQVQAARHDRYGETIGTFVTTEGLRYSPLLGRWQVAEVLDDKQILGLPSY